MDNEGKRSGRRTAKCPICGKLVEPRALSGHIRFGHKDSQLAREMLAHPSAKKLLRAELDKLRAADRAGNTAPVFITKKMNGAVTPPHVGTVEKMLDKTLATRRKIKELESLRTEKKGLFNGDDSVDLALKALHNEELDIADRLQAIGDAFPNKNKAIGNAGLFFGLFVAALGLPRLIDYLTKKKETPATATAATSASSVSGLGGKNPGTL